ncbi:MAG TPA: YdcF family protein [Gemmatimonadales bacterium]|nr:YdcF family protein [Gemmatimonadales bacterium]
MSLRRTGCLFLLVGVALAYVVSFLIVVVVSRRDQRQKADAIVVLGAAQYNGHPSPVLKARLDHGITLYKAGLAPLLMVTGGTASGDTESEAMVSRRYVLSNGIPDSVIIVRPEGRSTDASMEAVGLWLKQRDLHSVLLVSDPFHMCRLRFEARRMDLIPYSSPTRTSPISGSYRRELGYFAAEALKMPVSWVRSW